MLKILWLSEEPELNLKHWETEYLSSNLGSDIGYLIVGKPLPYSSPVSSSVTEDDVITCINSLTGLTRGSNRNVYVKVIVI